MIRRSGLAISTLLATGALALVAALPAAAQDDPPQSGDSRATAHPGNPQTCAEAGLEGDKVSVGYLIEPTRRYLAIRSVPPDVELTGIVIKGGPAYNVYGPEHRQGLHAPLNRGGQIPQISGWFVCGKDITTTTTTTTTTTSETTTTTTDTTTSDTTISGTTTDTTTETTRSDTTSVSSSPSTTTTSPGGGSAGGSDDDLPQTGLSLRGPLVAGGALLLIGGALVLAVRRTRGLRQH